VRFDRGKASSAGRRRGTRAHVLVIDGDDESLTSLRALLERAGYRVTAARDVRAGVDALVAGRPDAVVLDVAPSEPSRALEPIRAVSDVAVLVVSAATAELAKVRALKSGADDYVTKPFGRQELLARIEALLRRVGRPAVDPGYADSTLAVDFAQRRVSVGGREVALTPLEFKLLAAFVRQPNVVLSPERLRELVWSSSHGGIEEVRTYVFYLRRKLRPAEPIETVRGFGYRYRA
jgi:DNA-binding response OmpR family regulator